MGHQDVSLKAYLSDETRFADLINGMIGAGKTLVSAEHLTDADSQVIEQAPKRRKTSRHSKGTYKKIQPKYRDLVKKTIFGVNFIVVGIENQELTNYLMPLRCMSYDVREYENQAAKEGKKVMDAYQAKVIKLSDAEFLSRFRKESRLRPCITLVLYFGDDWDGATCLHELLDFQDIPQEFRPFVNDYHIHILNVKQLKSTEMFRSDLKLVFDSVRFADDKEKFREHVLKNPAFQNLDEEAYNIIQQYSNSRELRELEETISIRNEGGRVNMCKAITELIAEGREEGKLEGKIEERREIVRAMYRKGLGREMIIQVVSITEEELEKILAQ